MILAAEELCPQLLQEFEAVSLSRSTVIRRIQDLSEDLEAQLATSIENAIAYSLALDDSLDISDTAQLVIFIRIVRENLEVQEEMLDLIPMKDTTTGQDIFNVLEGVLEKFQLPWKYLTSIATDGAPAMKGANTGFMGRIQAKMNELGFCTIPIHCIIHQQSLCSKSVKLDGVMSLVVKITNTLRSKGFNHRQFKAFLEDIGCEHADIPYHCEVRWLSRAKVLERFFELRQEIALFMDMKGENVPELCDEKWVCDLAFLSDITSHLRDLNLSLQGKQLLIIHFSDKIKAFILKLSLWERHLSAKNLSFFSKLASVTNIQETSNFEEYVDILRTLRSEFETRFRDLFHLQLEFNIFATPFSLDVDSVPCDFQLELIDLQCDTELRDKFQTKEHLLQFYKNFPQKRFPKLHRHAARMLSMFGSTYNCERFFSSLKICKSRMRSAITDHNLKCILRLNSTVSSVPNIEGLLREKTHKKCKKSN